MSYSIDHGDHGQGKHGKDLHSIFTGLLTLLKYVFGGLFVLSLPFLFLKLVVFPIKLFIGLKAIALANTVLFATFVYRFLTRFGNRNRIPINNNGGIFNGFGSLNNKKLESIKQILNEQQNEADTSDDEIMADNSEKRVYYSRVSNDSALNEELNESELESQYNEEDVRNLLKLIKLKNKNW